MKQWFAKLGTTDIRHLLAIVWCVCSWITTIILIFHPVPKENEAVVYLAIGNQLASTALVLGYFFGASKRQTDNDKKQTP